MSNETMQINFTVYNKCNKNQDYYDIKYIYGGNPVTVQPGDTSSFSMTIDKAPGSSQLKLYMGTQLELTLDPIAGSGVALYPSGEKWLITQEDENISCSYKVSDLNYTFSMPAITLREEGEISIVIVGTVEIGDTDGDAELKAAPGIKNAAFAGV